MLIVTKHGDIFNMDNIFFMGEESSNNDYSLYAIGPCDSIRTLGVYQTRSEARNAKNRVIAAYTDGEPICRI